MPKQKIFKNRKLIVSLSRPLCYSNRYYTTNQDQPVEPMETDLPSVCQQFHQQLVAAASNIAGTYLSERLIRGHQAGEWVPWQLWKSQGGECQ